MSVTTLRPRLARVAPHGKKMVEVTIKFWTNNIAGRKGEIIPKHAWAMGMVRVSTNAAHGIESKPPMPFNSIAEIGPVIENLMIDHGIKLHLADKARKYMVGKPD